jgi:putative transposase
MIKTNENQFSVGMMCRMLSVSRSGYYSWRRSHLSNRKQANQMLKAEIKRVFDDEKGRPGSPAITRRLQEEGIPASRHRVAKLMRDNGLIAKAAKKYKATTHRNHSLPVALTCWNKISQRMHLIKSGYRISPIFGRKKVGCI